MTQPAEPPSWDPESTHDDDRTFLLLAHVGGAVGAFVTVGILAFVAPLIVYLAKGQASAVVRAHATAALNFQVLWSIVAFVLFFTGPCFYFIPSLIIVTGQIVLGCLAGVRANRGQLYRYPLSAPFIK